jgi:hypothetical protein
VAALAAIVAGAPEQSGSGQVEHHVAVAEIHSGATVHTM